MFIQEHRSEFSVVLMCEVLGVTKGGFYDWLKKKERGPTKKQRIRELTRRKIVQFFHQSYGTYGAVRIQRDLLDAGYRVSEKTVGRIMKEEGLRAIPEKAFLNTTDSNHTLPLHEDLLQQNFTVDKPNRAWVTDMTYVWTAEGWVYLAAVMDLFSRKIVGWEAQDNMRTEVPLAALEMAITFRQPGKGMIHHSDRGSQYASHEYQKALKGIEAKPSMSRKGNPYDNACMESFFATLKKEWIYRRRYRTREEAIASINRYITSFYNERRRHSAIDYLSPNQFERQQRIRTPKKISSPEVLI